MGLGALSRHYRMRRRGVEAVAIAMYEQFYGLRERPFDLSPNPRFLCFTAAAHAKR